MATSRGKMPAVLLSRLGIAELIAAGGFVALASLVPGGTTGFLIGALALLIAGTVLLVLARSARKRFLAYERMKREGRTATAKVTGMQTTGMFSKGQPYARISLDVLDGLVPRPVEVKDIVPILLTGRLTDERPIPVLIDPADTANVMIDWDAMLPGDAEEARRDP